MIKIFFTDFAIFVIYLTGRLGMFGWCGDGGKLVGRGHTRIEARAELRWSMSWCASWGSSMATKCSTWYITENKNC